MSVLLKSVTSKTRLAPLRPDEESYERMLTWTPIVPETVHVFGRPGLGTGGLTPRTGMNGDTKFYLGLKVLRFGSFGSLGFFRGFTDFGYWGA